MALFAPEEANHEAEIICSINMHHMHIYMQHSPAETSEVSQQSVSWQSKEETSGIILKGKGGASKCTCKAGAGR